MKIKMITSILLLAFITGGCSGTDLPSGVYMSNDPADFPLPTSGYTVYIVGETHGNKEAKMVFQAYLQSLYKEADVRDVILEEDQGHETDANAYVLGLTDEFPASLCLRADILGQIREFNTSLPAEAKVNVHLVDVDSPLTTIQKHLKELQTQMAPAADAVQIPYASELKNWSPEQRDELVEQFRGAAKGQPEVMSELDTIQQSFRWYELGNRMDIGPTIGEWIIFNPIREDVITKNIEDVLERLNNKPVLFFFGGSHGVKTVADDLPLKNYKLWAQRLIESGTRVYSLNIYGASGSGYWRDEITQPNVEVVDKILFKDGSPLVSLFESHPDKEIIFVDLRLKENSTIRFSDNYLDFPVPVSQIYDGLIIFKEFTPMEDACPQQRQ